MAALAVPCKCCSSEHSAQNADTVDADTVDADTVDADTVDADTVGNFVNHQHS